MEMPLPAGQICAPEARPGSLGRAAQVPLGWPEAGAAVMFVTFLWWQCNVLQVCAQPFLRPCNSLCKLTGHVGLCSLTEKRLRIFCLLLCDIVFLSGCSKEKVAWMGDWQGVDGSGWNRKCVCAFDCRVWPWPWPPPFFCLLFSHFNLSAW